MGRGSPFAVALMRAWAADDVAAPDLIDPMTQESLDLENAYGRAYSSTMVKGAVRGWRPSTPPSGRVSPLRRGNAVRARGAPLPPPAAGGRVAAP